MNDSGKLIKYMIILAALILAGYAAYRVYNWAVEDATKRIKQGVVEGVGEGVGGAMNPIKGITNMFGK